MSIFLTSGQQTALKILISQDEAECLSVIGLLVGREIVSWESVLHDDWVAIRNQAYPNWRAKDYTVSDAFKQALADARQSYRESVTGQMRLFG